jgi:hypothetical protein
MVRRRHCFGCGKDWYPRTPERPPRCPDCKSRRYDDEKLWAHRQAVGKNGTPSEFRKGKRKRTVKVEEVA